MTRVTFIGHGGAARAVDVTPGASLMRGAVCHGIAGIAAICGGACACGTCHVYIEEGWVSVVTPMSLAEEGLLGVLANTRPNSRLACQITISDRLDGLVVQVPEPG